MRASLDKSTVGARIQDKFKERFQDRFQTSFIPRRLIRPKVTRFLTRSLSAKDQDKFLQISTRFHISNQNYPFYPQEEQMKKPQNNLKEVIPRNKFTFLFLSLKFMKASKLPQPFASFPNYQHFMQDIVFPGLWGGILLSLILLQSSLFDKFMLDGGKNIWLIQVNT